MTDEGYKPPEYMKTSMTQEDWDEFSEATSAFAGAAAGLLSMFPPFVEAATKFYEVMVKFQDDLPLTTEQRELLRKARK